MYGKISRTWHIPLPIRKRVRIFTREEKRRWSVALPTPKNYTVSVIAACGGFLRLPSSACLLPPCRIWRRSPTYAGGIPPISSRFSSFLAKNKAYLVSEIGFVSSLNHPIGWFFFLAEREGFEPSCACAQTDFESVRQLGSYRTMLPQSRHILEVVFQLLNASAALSSLLEFWRESQTRWRYYSTKTPENQGVLRK